MHKLTALVLACACAVHINLVQAGEIPIDIIPAAERQHAADFTLDTLPVSYTHLTLPTNREV